MNAQPRTSNSQDVTGASLAMRLLGPILCTTVLSAAACAPLTEGGTEAAAPAPRVEQKITEEAYTTYFAFNSDRLDDDARAVVAEAVASAKAANLNKVVISGHSDSAGTADYNRRLSKARVEAVASEFVDSGLPLSKIEIRVFGEEQPQVETADGQSAAQNRRAEIRLVKSIALAPAPGTAPTTAGEASPEASSKETGCDYVYIWSAGRAVPVCLEKRTQALPQPK